MAMFIYGCVHGYMFVGSFQGTERQWADPSVEPPPQPVEHALHDRVRGYVHGYISGY